MVGLFFMHLLYCRQVMILLEEELGMEGCTICTESQNELLGRLVCALEKRDILEPQDLVALCKTFEEHEALTAQDFLFEEGIVDKEDLLSVLEEVFGVKAIDVIGTMFDHAIIRSFPKGVLLRNNVIPYLQDGLVLIVIAGNPEVDGLESVLREYVDSDIQFFVGIPQHIDMMIKDFYQDELYQVDFENTIAQAHYQDEDDRYYWEHEREHFEEGERDIELDRVFEDEIADAEEEE